MSSPRSDRRGGRPQSESSDVLNYPSSPPGDGGRASSPQTPGSQPQRPLVQASPVQRFRADLGSGNYAIPREILITSDPASQGEAGIIPSSGGMSRGRGMGSGGSGGGGGDDPSSGRGSGGGGGGGGPPRGPSSSDRLHMDPTSEVARTMIWGTTVNTDHTTRQFREFFTTYTPDGMADPLYPQLMDDAKETETFNINLNATHLYDHAPDLYQNAVRFPQEVVTLFDLVVNDLYRELYEAEPQSAMQVRIFNLLSSVNMRELNPTDIDQLVSVRGMVIRSTSIIPDLRQAFFKCSNCQQTESVTIDRGRIDEPQICPNQACQRRGTMTLVHNRCSYLDKQLVKMQETPESIPEGETPHTVTLACYDELVDVAKPGDRVEITGVYRAIPIRENPRQRAVKSIYRTYIDVVHFRKTEGNRMRAEDPNAEAESEWHTTFAEGTSVSSERAARKAKLEELAAQPDVYERLTRSLAPGIWEMDDIKKGILCQLFGGVNKEFERVSGGKFRGEINVLLCGDPGTSKSQLLQWVHKIAPRGIYTSGKGSSAVGLTAYITKDPDSGERVLESGALVLSDRGICCIDEFDKMNDATRSILHEAMEQQTVSIAKAGIICTLNARTSILASANPRDSRYNPNLSVVDNIQLPPTLLSRFDLIYLVLDQASETRDRRLAKHLVGLYYEEPELVDDTVDVSLLTEYISHARQHIHPTITDAAFGDLVSGYVDMRKLGGNKHTITATPRQLESLVRLSEALARMRFSPTVDRSDVAESLRLMRVALQQAATDPRSGTIDMDLINSGTSALARQHQGELREIVRRLINSHDGPTILFDELFRRVDDGTAWNVSKAELRDCVTQIEQEEPSPIVITERNTSNMVIRKTQ